MATCKACGASIVWVQTLTKRWVPCNEGLIPYKLDPKGDQSLMDDRGEVIRCRTAFDGKADGSARLPHWATCPYADSFKRGGKA